METPQKNFSSLLYHYLGLAEKVVLVMASIGLLLVFLELERTYLLPISLITLAIIFFLAAFRPIPIERSGDEKFGFRELLAYAIAPKVLWLGSSVSVLGALFMFFGLPHEEVYFQLLLIGGAAIVTGIAILGFAGWTGAKHIGLVVPILFRAVPILLADIYLIYAIIEIRSLFGEL